MIFDRLPYYLRPIVELVILGKSNKEIAEQLGTTENKVKGFMHTIFNKVGCESRLQLANLITEERQ